MLIMQTPHLDSTHSPYINTMFIKQENAFRMVMKAPYKAQANTLFLKFINLKLHDMYFQLHGIYI